MNTTKLIICTLVGTVYLFLIEYLWYAQLGNGGGEGDAMPALHWMVLGYLLMALGFCLIYAKGVESGSATQQGLRFGLLVAVMLVGTNFMWLSLTDSFPCMGVDLMSTIKNSVFVFVEMGILGIIVAHLSGLSGAPSTSRGDTGGTKDKSDPEPPPPTGPGG